MTVFDSNIWIAVFHTPDSQHTKAATLFTLYNPPYLLPEYVFLETANVLIRVAGKPVVDAFLDRVLQNSDVEMLFGDMRILRNISEFFRRKSHHGLSFVDVALLYLSFEHDVVTFDQKLAKAIRDRQG